MMQTITAKRHNEISRQRWHEACSKWHRSRGLDSYPQLSMYGFNKNYGYVTFDLELHTSCWRRTKKESIEAFLYLINRK